MRIDARYFDGRRSTGVAVQLRCEPGMVYLTGDGVQRSETLGALRVGERMGSAPRRIEFADGAHCEVADGPAFQAWCANLGHGDGWVDRAQRVGTVAVAAALLVAIVIVVGYHWGLPLASAWVAHRLPAGLVGEISERTLALLDARLLQASALEPERRDPLQAAFNRLAGNTQAELLFRSSPEFGANAMALPDGRIVLLDELVVVVEDDDAVLAVLAHELTHVEHRHGLQAMVRGAVVGALVAWWIGDFGPLIAAAPVALLQARHSRALESEADRDAAKRLCAHGYEPLRLAEALQKISDTQQSHGSEPVDKEQRWRRYLDSHPGVTERVVALRALRCG